MFVWTYPAWVKNWHTDRKSDIPQFSFKNCQLSQTCNDLYAVNYEYHEIITNTITNTEASHKKI